MSTYNNTTWRAANEERYREIVKECNKNWRENNKAYQKERCAKWNKERREAGSTKYCRKGYDQIANYALALQDKFNPKLWHLHHIEENEHSSAWLKEHNQYFNITPDKLIWLPADEHKADLRISIKHPDQSKWHKRALE